MSGGDRLTANFMRRDPFTFTPNFKLDFSANDKPSLRTIDEAMKARIQVIPFTVFIPPENRDHKLLETLKEEGPGILRWLIDGCLEWQRIGLKPPPCVVAASEEYIKEQDIVAQWIDEECAPDPKTPTTLMRLWWAWKAWAESAEAPGRRSQWKKHLIEEGHYEEKTSEGIGLHGLRLKTDHSGTGPTTNGAGKGPTPKGPSPNGAGHAPDEGPPPTFAVGDDPATVAMRRRENGGANGSETGPETIVGEGFTISRPRK